MPAGRPAVEGWVRDHLGDLAGDDVAASPSFTGGQQSADAALAAFDVAGYAAGRNEVLPATARGASRLSPFIRHGLLQLRRVWDHVEGGPARDVRKYRFELRWQEYARHWYARLGIATREGTRYRQADPSGGDPWDPDMACMQVNLDELHGDGWVVNQARMWMASQWVVRCGAAWRDGEDRYFRHLLDGSRATNRLGWQWTAGLSRQKHYGFSRRQVLRRAPGLCDGCRLRDECPIASWPEARPRREAIEPERLRSDPDPSATAGPASVVPSGEPEAVWLTAESLGDDDPALAAHPRLPVLFVFDEPLLAKLRLSGKRLVFLAECLADLAQRRSVEVWRGRPSEIVAERAVAVTFAPVPGFRRLASRLDLAEVHPWPWLRRPDGRSVASFSQWDRPGRAAG